MSPDLASHEREENKLLFVLILPLRSVIARVDASKIIKKVKKGNKKTYHDLEVSKLCATLKIGDDRFGPDSWHLKRGKACRCQSKKKKGWRCQSKKKKAWRCS